MINVIVFLQALTFVGAAVAFAFAGDWRLAVAQVCYVVATAALFLR